MKSSKIDNIFNYNPSLEDQKPLSPFNLYQPFQSSFDPEFTLQQPKATPRHTPPQMRKWNQSFGNVGDRTVGSLRMPGGSVFNPWDNDTESFLPQPSSFVKNSFPGTSTSSWGETEGRNSFNSTWRNPTSSRSYFPQEEAQQPSRYFMTGGDGLGMQSQFTPRTETSYVSLTRPDSAFGSGYRAGGSFGQTNTLGGNYDSGLTNSGQYPLMFGRNMNHNMQRSASNRPMMCNFCKNNKEVPDIYLNHYLYDPETRVLSCPVLRKHVCEICGGTGDQAHTLQYCPVNRERGLQSKVPVLLKTRTITNSTGKIRRH